MPNRITLGDKTATIIKILSNGNTGAISVMSQLIKYTCDIDPDSKRGAFDVFMDLDNYDIVGADIWNLYKHVCGENLPRFIALLRAVQLGIISKDALEDVLIYGDSPEVDHIARHVKEQLPNFNLDFVAK